ncbi:hypothetical protein SNEBB_007377 [Seison nebaliae]|nr:hypothetical protein SNEBB_007377 [Seison nebaliae]
MDHQLNFGLTDNFNNSILVEDYTDNEKNIWSMHHQINLQLNSSKNVDGKFLTYLRLLFPLIDKDISRHKFILKTFSSLIPIDYKLKDEFKSQISSTINSSKNYESDTKLDIYSFHQPTMSITDYYYTLFSIDGPMWNIFLRESPSKVIECPTKFLPSIYINLINFQGMNKIERNFLEIILKFSKNQNNLRSSYLHLFLINFIYLGNFVEVNSPKHNSISLHKKLIDEYLSYLLNFPRNDEKRLNISLIKDLENECSSRLTQIPSSSKIRNRQNYFKSFPSFTNNSYPTKSLKLKKFDDDDFWDRFEEESNLIDKTELLLKINKFNESNDDSHFINCLLFLTFPWQLTSCDEMRSLKDFILLKKYDLQQLNMKSIYDPFNTIKWKLSEHCRTSIFVYLLIYLFGKCKESNENVYYHYIHLIRQLTINPLNEIVEQSSILINKNNYIDIGLILHHLHIFSFPWRFLYKFENCIQTNFSFSFHQIEFDGKQSKMNNNISQMNVELTMNEGFINVLRPIERLIRKLSQNLQMSINLICWPIDSQKYLILILLNALQSVPIDKYNFRIYEKMFVKFEKFFKYIADELTPINGSETSLTETPFNISIGIDQFPLFHFQKLLKDQINYLLKIFGDRKFQNNIIPLEHFGAVKRRRNKLKIEYVNEEIQRQLNGQEKIIWKSDGKMVRTGWYKKANELQEQSIRKQRRCSIFPFCNHFLGRMKFSVNDYFRNYSGRMLSIFHFVIFFLFLYISIASMMKNNRIPILFSSLLTFYLYLKYLKKMNFGWSEEEMNENIGKEKIEFISNKYG